MSCESERYLELETVEDDNDIEVTNIPEIQILDPKELRLRNGGSS